MKSNILFLIISLFFFISCSKDDNELKNEPEGPIVNNPEFEITFDSQILTSTNTLEILRIFKREDGFILFCTEITSEWPLTFGTRVIKIDNQFNQVWTFLVNEINSTNFFGGVYELPNDEYILISSKNGVNGNETYGLKFNNSGNILWRKNFNSTIAESGEYFDFMIPFTSKSNRLKFITRSYTPDDSYFREVEINSDGEILANIELNYPDVNQFGNIAYGNDGIKYNIGARALVDFLIGGAPSVSNDALLIKYNENNQVIFDKTYGMKRVDDSYHRILIDSNNKPTVIGTWGVDYAEHIEGRWIVRTNSVGEIVWEIKEYKKQYKYYGKDIIQDDDGNYLYLFDDFSWGSNIVTLIKSNDNGEILWKFEDGIEGNLDRFTSAKVFKINGEYLIFGLNEQKLWVKKMKVHL